jgi:TRAP-type C4-dicarboxylate transport system permease small subunit
LDYFGEVLWKIGLIEKALEMSTKDKVGPDSGSIRSATHESKNSRPPESRQTLRKTRWIAPLEAIAAALIAGIIGLLLTGVVSRYLLGMPIAWIDETVSMGFIWVGMIGSAIAMHRNEHLRLTTFVDRMPVHVQKYVHAFALMSVVSFLLAMISPAIEHTKDEWIIAMPTLQIPNSFRVAAIAVGIVLMLIVALVHMVRTTALRHVAAAALATAAIALVCYVISPALAKLGNTNLIVFLVLFVGILLVAGVPIAFCFGVGF